MSLTMPLTIENLGLVVEGKSIFACLHLEVKTSQFISIMGENGVGKTCLLEAIVGSRKISKGKILYWGKPKNEYDQVEFFSNIAWVSSSPEAYPLGARVFDLVDFLRRRYPTWNDSIAHNLCEKFKLSPTKKLSELSLGEHSKMRLIKAICFEPKLLLLDELTANLSPDSKSAVLSALMDVFSRTEMSVLYVCHSKEEANRFSDQIFELTESGFKEKKVEI